MAIQNRRGKDADFDSTKMLPGELAVTTDGSRKVYVAFAPGDAKELASAEEVQEIIDGFNEDVAENIQKATEEIEQKKKEALAEIPNHEEKLAELEVYKANSIITTSSGKTFHETDCAAVPPVNIKLFGKGKQETVPGNQLLNIPINWNNGNVSIVGDGATLHVTSASCNVEYAVLKAFDDLFCFEVGETYSISRKEAYMNLGFWFYDSDENIVCTLTTEFGDGENKTIPNSAARVTMYFADLTNGATYDFDQSFMLNKGEQKDWEPYVGGEASPNMNYPQKVESLGEGGSIVGKVLTGNLFDCGAYSENDITGNGDIRPSVIIPVKAGSYILGRGNVSSINIYYRTFTNGVYGAGTPTTQNTTYLITLETDGNIIISTDSSVDLSLATDVILSVGTEIQSYEPYTEQPFTFLTPNGLRGIPLGQTMPDTIKNSPIHMSGVYWDNATSQYQIADTKNEDGKDVQRLIEYDISLFENHVIIPSDSSWYDSEKSYSYECYLDDTTKILIDGGFCTHSTHYPFHEFYGQGIETGVFLGRGMIVVNISKELGICTTIDEFKQWFADNNVRFYQILADPIITDTSEEEKAQLDALVMNYPNTTIVNDAGAYMEVTHVKDTRKHIEQNYVSKAMHEEHESRIAELEKAIVNS